MTLKVCQYCGFAYESTMHHDCPQAKIASLSSRIVELEGALSKIATGEPTMAFATKIAKAALSSPHQRGSDTRDDNNQWPEFNRER